MADPGDGEIRFCETIDLIQIQGGRVVHLVDDMERRDEHRSDPRSPDVRFRAEGGTSRNLGLPVVWRYAMLLLSCKSRPPTNLVDY
jgi:hypothetical protein